MSWRDLFRRKAESNVDRAFDEAVKAAAKVVGVELTAEERQEIRIEVAGVILRRAHARLVKEEERRGK